MTATATVALRRSGIVWAPLLAATLALLATMIGWRGVDLPAQIYRVGLFHREGLTLWDSQWYGGHWTLNYSVIFPPAAGLLGVQVTGALSAAIAALTFDRLALGHFGRAARLGSLLFAGGTLVQVAIGQLPFLLGEALALGAIWAATRGRWRLAGALAVVSSLASPLAGAFLALAGLAWLFARWPQRRLARAGLVAGPGVPVVILAAAFPGQGIMPFPALDFVGLALVFVAAWGIVPAHERALRAGLALYLLAIILSFALPTPVGGNVGRLGECLGGPLAACLLWPSRRRLLPVIVVPMALLQWGPALEPLLASGTDPSTQAAYFRPLISFLGSHTHPAARVEIVPTRRHWEAAYVAPFAPLARGWERQLDTADNQIFYTEGALTPASYRAWLLDNGVRFVALGDVALDYAGRREGSLLTTGVPGLRPIWHNRHWRVFEVAGGRGLVQGPARLISADANQVVLQASRAGDILLRVRYSPRWSLVEGQGCLRAGSAGWTTVQSTGPGRLNLQMQLLAQPLSACPQP